MTPEARDLSIRYGDYWASHPVHGVEDWKAEVSNGDTRQGYWDWVLEAIERDEEIEAESEVA